SDNRPGGYADLAGDHFDFAVDAVHDIERPLVDLALVLGDRTIFAFRQHDAGKCTDRLLDHVAAWRDHRPRGVGERLAALVGDELQRNDGRAMGDDDIGQLAGLHANV